MPKQHGQGGDLPPDFYDPTIFEQQQTSDRPRSRPPRLRMPDDETNRVELPTIRSRLMPGQASSDEQHAPPKWLPAVIITLSLIALVAFGLVANSLGMLKAPSALVLGPTSTVLAARTATARANASAIAAQGGASIASADAITPTGTTTPTVGIPDGFLSLPADAPNASWGVYPNPADGNSLNPLSAGAPYVYENVRQGDRCQIRLPGNGPNASGGGMLWVDCRMLGLPDPTPVPPPPTPVPHVPVRVCGDVVVGIDGTFQDCAMDGDYNALTASARQKAGAPLAPEPTVCIASDDGAVTICGYGGPTTMKLQANAAAADTATAVARQAAPPPASAATPTLQYACPFEDSRPECKGRADN
jgi:hypothetical protein